MTTFKNANFVKWDYECTNVVACVAPAAPKGAWIEADASVLDGLTMLWREGDVRYYGWL